MEETAGFASRADDPGNKDHRAKERAPHQGG